MHSSKHYFFAEIFLKQVNICLYHHSKSTHQLLVYIRTYIFIYIYIYIRTNTYICMITTTSYMKYLVLFQILSGILRQSYPNQLRSNWVRQWVMWWWLGGVVISVAYTMNLIAFLTVPKKVERIETIDQLAASELRYSTTIKISISLYTL